MFAFCEFARGICVTSLYCCIYFPNYRNFLLSGLPPPEKWNVIYRCTPWYSYNRVPFFPAMWEVDFGPQLRHSEFQPEFVTEGESDSGVMTTLAPNSLAF